METMYTGIKFIFYIQPLTGGLHLVNDTLHFLFDAYVFFVNTPVPTRLRLKQAPVFTDNVLFQSKCSQMSYYKGHHIFML